MSVDQFKDQLTIRASYEFHTDTVWCSMDLFKTSISHMNPSRHCMAYQFFEIGLAIKVFIKKQEQAAQAVYRTMK
jgi:hypothetical protein